MKLAFLAAALLGLAALVSAQSNPNPPPAAAPNPPAPSPPAPNAPPATAPNAPPAAAPAHNANSGAAHNNAAPAPNANASPTVSAQPTQTARSRPNQQQPPAAQNNNNNNQGNRPGQNRPAQGSPASGGVDVYTYITRSAQHKVLTKLIEFANLTNSFRGLKDVTVFAPTDAAFYLTLRDLRYKREEDVESVTKFWILLLTQHKELFQAGLLLPYHVIKPKRRLDYLTSSTTRTAELSVITLANRSVEFESDGLKDKAVAMPNPNYTTPNNYLATNGYVHSLDRVLFYTNFSRPEAQRKVVNLQAQFNANSSGGGSVCFPATSRVQLKGGRTIRLSTLRGGHEVIVDPTGTTSRVFLFTHRQHNGYYNFVRLHTVSGRHITLSGSHYLYANGRLTAAHAVRPGDHLSTIDGTSGKVAFIEQVVEKGLVAPHTLHGNIVVDGIVASSYTTAVSPRVARILLAPLRASVRMGLATEPLGGLLYNGADRLAKLLPRGAAQEAHF